MLKCSQIKLVHSFRVINYLESDSDFLPQEVFWTAPFKFCLGIVSQQKLFGSELRIINIEGGGRGLRNEDVKITMEIWLNNTYKVLFKKLLALKANVSNKP